jgi:hypothetical protein
MTRDGVGALHLDRDVEVIFYGAGEKRKAEVREDLIHEPGGGDIAFLSTNGSLPSGVEAALLGSAAGTSGGLVKSYGFPKGHEDGLFADGRVVGLRETGNAKSLQISSSEITRGFSGAPAWHQGRERVIGMVQTITVPDAYGRLTNTVFLVPTDSLREAYPELILVDRCPYVGLRPFERDDSEFFFGRDRAVSRLEKCCAPALDS